jgi:hypothetical protein
VKHIISEEEIAHIAYEANRMFRGALGEPPMPEWLEASPAYIENIKAGVKAALKFPGVTARESHTEWLEVMRGLGWKYGKVMDVDRRENPMILEYDDLPIPTRVGFELFASIITVLVGNG